MFEEYIGTVMTYEDAYFKFAGYSYAMIDLVKNERGKNYKGKVICVSNNSDEIRKAFEPYQNQPRALLQGYGGDDVLHI